MNTKNKEISFTIDNLKKIINKLNLLLGKVKLEEEEEKKMKNFINYISKFNEKIIAENKAESKFEFLTTLIENFSKEIYEKIGDELIENLWKMYFVDTNFLNFSPYEIINKFCNKKTKEFEVNNNPQYFINLFLMNKLLTEKLIKNNTIEFISEKNEINFNLNLLEYKDFLTEDIFESYKELSLKMQVNNIIDLITLKILTIGNIQGFYTTLSSMLLMTEGKTVLIFKIISLFALCLYKFLNKESFIGGLLYILGGILRDYAKSYLNTKGLESFLFTEHKCAHKDHDRNFFKITNLSNNECKFLEENFLTIIKEFISIIIFPTFSNLENSENSENSNLSKWDSYKNIFTKYIYTENLDFEENIPAHIQIIQYISLFFCDFIFTFISGFGKFDENKKKLISIFSKFDNFCFFGLKFFTKSYENMFTVYEFCKKKDNFFTVDCEKTEYLLTDKLNSYGVCFIVSLYLEFYRKNSSEEILFFSGEEKTRILPSAYSNNFLLDKIFFSFGNFINAEKRQRKPLCPLYREYIEGYLLDYLNDFEKKELKEFYLNSEFNKNFCFFLLNYFKIEEKERNGKLAELIIGGFEDKQILYLNVIKELKDNSGFNSILNCFDFINKKFQIGEKKLKGIFFGLILSIFLNNNSLILSKENFEKFYEILKENENSVKEYCIEAIKELNKILKEDINSINDSIISEKLCIDLKEKNENFEFLKFFDLKKIKNKEDVIEKLEQLLKDVLKFE